jgi:hypothetical protein
VFPKCCCCTLPTMRDSFLTYFVDWCPCTDRTILPGCVVRVGF